jgi:hypothetical protein
MLPKLGCMAIVRARALRDGDAIKKETYAPTLPLCNYPFVRTAYHRLFDPISHTEPLLRVLDIPSPPSLYRPGRK